MCGPRQVGQPGAAAQDDLAGAVGVQLEAGQLPAADVRLQAQHGGRCGPGRARWDPQRRVLVIRGRLHRDDCACPTPIGHVLVARSPDPACSAAPADGRMDGDRDRSRGDDVTEPGPSSDVPDADRAEQQALVDPPDPPRGTSLRPATTCRRPTRSSSSWSARPGEAGGPSRPVGDREANEADVLEQEIDVPADDDEIPG